MVDKKEKRTKEDRFKSWGGSAIAQFLANQGFCIYHEISEKDWKRRIGESYREHEREMGRKPVRSPSVQLLRAFANDNLLPTEWDTRPSIRSDLEAASKKFEFELPPEGEYFLLGFYANHDIESDESTLYNPSWTARVKTLFCKPDLIEETAKHLSANTPFSVLKYAYPGQRFRFPKFALYTDGDVVRQSGDVGTRDYAAYDEKAERAKETRRFFEGMKEGMDALRGASF